MSVIISQPELLRQHVIQQQREVAEEISKKGIKLYRVAAAPTPPPIDNKNNINLLKKILLNFDLSNNKIINPDLLKNLNKFSKFVR